MPNKKTAKKKVTTSKKVAAKKTAKTKKPKYKPRQFSSQVVDGDDRARVGRCFMLLVLEKTILPVLRSA